MSKHIIKNTKNGYRTDEKMLAEEIRLALSDYFCGEIVGKEKAVLINLENGQKFRLTVEETAV